MCGGVKAKLNLISDGRIYKSELMLLWPNYIKSTLHQRKGMRMTDITTSQKILPSKPLGHLIQECNRHKDLERGFVISICM